MHTGQICRNLNRDSSITRLLHNLTSWDADPVFEAVELAEGDWSVQRSSDYTDNLLLLVEPLDDTLGRPTYVISPELNGLELAELRDDELHSLGTFNTMTELANTLLPLLTA